jgi:hypothetical protein
VDQVASLARELKLDLGVRLAARFADLPRAWPAPRVLAGLWLRLHVPPKTAEFIEEDILLSIGEALVRESELDLLREALVWLRATKHALMRHKRRFRL